MSVVMDQFSGSYGRFFTIPQDEEDRSILLAVDRRTKDEVEARYGFLTDYEWHMNTIANTTFETIIKTLAFMLNSKNNKVQGLGINFYDLFKVGVSIKRNEKAEKEGNINVFFEPGDKMDSLIQDGPPEPYRGPIYSPLQEFAITDPEQKPKYDNLDHHVRFELSDKHGLLIKDNMSYAVFAITYVFFENLVSELIMRLAHNDQDPEADPNDEKMVSVNFNDNLEIHAVLKDGHVTIMMRPGLNAKLLIKNDGMTESTMGDLDNE